MSKISIEGNASGTGTFTIASPNSNSNFTFTLPTESGTVTVFASGTAMLFVQTTAPTGWTKSTTHNNKALRIVSGTASSGGSVAFTTAFASKTPAGTVSVTGISGTVGNYTLTTSDIPSHNHSLTFNREAGGGVAFNFIGSASANVLEVRNTGDRTVGSSVGSTGGGGAHSHTWTFSSGTATFSGSAINLAVQYVDVIIATKD